MSRGFDRWCDSSGS